MCVCIKGTDMCHMYVGVYGCQEAGWDLEVELQAVVSWQIWVSGTELRSCGGVEWVFSHWAIPQSLCFLYLFIRGKISGWPQSNNVAEVNLELWSFPVLSLQVCAIMPSLFGPWDWMWGYMHTRQDLYPVRSISNSQIFYFLVNDVKSHSLLIRHLFLSGLCGTLKESTDVSLVWL